MSRRQVRLFRAATRRRAMSLRAHVEMLESRELLTVPAHFVVTTAADSGPGSLRQAILDANASPGSFIDFNIPNNNEPVVISPLSALPAVTAQTYINGYTEPGAVTNPVTDKGIDQAAPLIQIDGGQAGANVDGLTINSPNSYVAGLIITHFSGNGVTISGPNAQGNLLYGDFIGTVPNPGTGRDFATGFGNGGSGVVILASNNRVGTDSAGDRNIIQGNNVGISLTGPGATGNLIQGSFILNNTHQGVLIDTSNNTIGEDIPGGGNIISGNGDQGVLITGGPDVQGNLLEGNEIGTDLGIGQLVASGMMPLPNGAEGVLIENSPNNTIGGLLSDQKNVIGGNHGDGLVIDGAASTGNLVEANWIGMDEKDGAISLIIGNQDGIRITSSGNTIGGTVVAAQNTVSVNHKHGIELVGAGATGNLIEGNDIGLNPEGGSDFGNTLDGINVNNAPNNTIGGVNGGARNVISGNNNGITLIGPGATGTLIEGNLIGTRADGVSKLENAVDGISLQDAPSNTIGGTASGAGNVISGNNRGIDINSTTSPGSRDNLIQGNSIGTDRTGTANDSNAIDGIIITNSSNNTIGGSAAGAGNTIAFNAGNGILIQSGTNNPLISNKIYTNTGLGINLGGGGVLPNHNPPSTTGPNLLQNYPVLTSATPSGGATNVQGTLNAAPNTTYTIEFFSNAVQDPTNFGQGQTPLGTTTVVTDGSGKAVINVNVPTAVPSGEFITATATDPNNNTSEFSNDVPSVPVQIQFSPSTYFVSNTAGTVTITVTRTGGAGGQVLVSYATSGGTAIPGADYTATSGTLTFSPNQTSQTFTIPILDNSQATQAVSVNLVLSNPTGGAILGQASTGTVTIEKNNQLSMQFSTGSFSANESDKTATITVNRSSPNGVTSIHFATSGGSAVPGLDYTPTSGVLTFTQGQTTQTFTIPIRDRFLTSGSETIGLTLSSPTGGAIGNPGTALLTIHNNGGTGGNGSGGNGSGGNGSGGNGSGGNTPIASSSIPGPVITDVATVNNGRAITAFIVTCNEPLDPSTAQDLGNYGYYVVGSGPDNIFGDADDFSVLIHSALYDPGALRVILVPQSPLPLNGFYQVSVNPTSTLMAGHGVTDVNGDLVDGANNGGSGTSFVTIVGLGTRLNFADHLGSQVTLQTNRGFVEVHRFQDGDIQFLRMVNAIPRRTTLSGQARVARQFRRIGVTVPVITGAAGVRIRLRRPTFRVGSILP